jgi:hypothetical protein
MPAHEDAPAATPWSVPVLPTTGISLVVGRLSDTSAFFLEVVGRVFMLRSRPDGNAIDGERELFVFLEELFGAPGVSSVDL